MEPNINQGTVASANVAGSPADGDVTASPRKTTFGHWTRLVAWLGLGCIGAGNPATGDKHCAPGCVTKPVGRKRRKRLAVAHRMRLRPPPTPSAPGALARKSRQVLERVLFWVSP
jgi:hypothetical protein